MTFKKTVLGLIFELSKIKWSVIFFNNSSS